MIPLRGLPNHFYWGGTAVTYGTMTSIGRQYKAYRRECTATSQWTIHPYSAPSWHNKSVIYKEIDTIIRRVNYAQFVRSMKIWNLRAHQHETIYPYFPPNNTFSNGNILLCAKASSHEHVRGRGGKVPCALDLSTRRRFPTRLLYSRSDEYTQYGSKDGTNAGERKQNVLHLPCIQPKFFCCTAHCVVQ